MRRRMSLLTRTGRALALACATVIGASGLGLVAPVAASAATDDDVLTTDERLEEGDRLVSPSGRYALEITGGVLSLTERASRFAAEIEAPLAEGVGSLLLQQDGNLVLFTPEGAVLDSFGTGGSGATAVRLQDDRNVVFFAADERVVAELASYRQLVLLEGEALLPGDVVAGGGGTALHMQPDGNLVLYRGSTPLWDSRTGGNPGAGAAIQTDGNLVVYSQDGRPLYASGSSKTVGDDSLALLEVEDTEISVKKAAEDQFDVSLWSSNSRTVADPRGANGVLAPGDELEPGEFRTAGACRLIMQTDGNLVEYCGLNARSQRAVWSSGVPRAATQAEYAVSGVAAMQADGNLVVYRVTALGGTSPVLTTGTGFPGSRLLLQSDTNLVVYAPDGRPTWSRAAGRIR